MNLLNSPRMCQLLIYVRFFSVMCLFAYYVKVYKYLVFYMMYLYNLTMKFPMNQIISANNRHDQREHNLCGA